MALLDLRRKVEANERGRRIASARDCPARENISPEGRVIVRFETSEAPVAAGFDHPNYAPIAVVPEAVRAALAEDFA